ncbi:MAG TPA: DUF835 domain-containing protein [Thermoplasmata archaeon]|nr:DUF835 domain-containing protein [Thermoplasmata archaeon]
MGNARHALFALTLVLILFWIVVPTTVGQGAAGLYNVSTDYELFGTADLHGGGHVTWSLTGARASELRMRILHLFDEYPAIPRGFPFPNAPTKANGDGRLDAVEGASYTDLLEMQLEAGTRGTQAQYLTLFPFDLRNKVADPGTSFDRSTSGLAGTRANASAPVEIRFLFEANTSTTDAQVPLSTAVLAQAPFDIFSYEAVEDPTFAWPFPIGPAGAIGWHNVSVAGGPQAMWAGNLATGRYENNMDAYSTTTADPSYATNPAYLPFDFRFASRAWITFNYTGSLNDAGDYLRLEYAAAPYTSWSNVTLGSGADLPPSVGVWSQEMADLSGLLGQRVRLRLHFHSDSAGTGAGFYLRDFQVRAPVDSGEVVAGDAHYLVGTLSFSDPRVGAGGLQIVRTPGGELMTYSASWGPSGPPGDTIRFRTFDGFENPQILFGVMIAACYAISRFQESAYEAFREAHPPVYRPLLHRAKWLHRIGLVASGLLILFYFVPTVLGFVGLRVFVSGPAYWIMAVAGVLLFGFGSRLYYRQRLDRAPPMDVAEEPPAVPKIIIPASVAGGVGGPRNQLSLRCQSCAELQTVREGTDPRAAICSNCGHHLRRLEEGKRYLIVANGPAIAVSWMRDLVKGGRPAIILTTESPERLRKEFRIKKAPIVQISGRASGAVDPKQLDPVGLRAMLPLAREGKGGVVLYDGLDQIVAEGSLDDVIKFLRKANDMAFVHGVTVIGRIAPGRLADPDVKRLNGEFDEFLDLSAQS